jgi:hypothetical protein
MGNTLRSRHSRRRVHFGQRIAIRRRTSTDPHARAMHWLKPSQSVLDPYGDRLPIPRIAEPKSKDCAVQAGNHLMLRAN